MKRALVFGVNGFVGKYLTREFLNNGYEVYGSSRMGQHPLNNISTTYICDILDADQVKNVISEVAPDIIINLAGRSSVGIFWRIPRNTVEVNVCGSLNILEALKTYDLDCKVLLVGSSEEYDKATVPISEYMPLKATNPYGISKMMLERFAEIYRQHYNMKIYFVRSFNHTGIGQTDTFVIPSWCRQAAEISESGSSGIMTVGNLDIIRDFSDVRDIVRAYRLIIESDDCEKVFNVGSGRAISLREIVEYIKSLSKQPIYLKTNSKLIRPIENDIIYCDRTQITKTLGWEPEYDIFDTIKEMFEYYEKKLTKTMGNYTKLMGDKEKYG